MKITERKKIGRRKKPEADLLIAKTIRFTESNWQWISSNIEQLRVYVRAQSNQK